MILSNTSAGNSGMISPSWKYLENGLTYIFTEESVCFDLT